MNCICHIIFIQTHLKVTDMYSPTVIHLLMEKLLVKNVYLNIINRARKYVYICTPYLIIDNEMMTALCLAAKVALMSVL